MSSDNDSPIILTVGAVAGVLGILGFLAWVLGGAVIGAAPGGPNANAVTLDQLAVVAIVAIVGLFSIVALFVIMRDPNT